MTWLMRTNAKYSQTGNVACAQRTSVPKPPSKLPDTRMRESARTHFSTTGSPLSTCSGVSSSSYTSNQMTFAPTHCMLHRQQAQMSKNR